MPAGLSRTGRPPVPNQSAAPQPDLRGCTGLLDSGRHHSGGSELEAPGIRRALDGSTCSNVSGVEPSGRQASILYDVSRVTSSDCWGVGGQQTLLQGNDPVVLMEHWNGTHWSVANTPQIGGLLFSVSCMSAGDCWTVGGTMDNATGNVVGSLAFHWDGSSWTRQAIPASGQDADQLSSVSCVSAADC